MQAAHIGLSELLGMDNREQPPRPLHEAQIMTLRELFDVYRKPRFQPGDLITPRKGFGLVNDGEPHIVLEIDYDTKPYFGLAEQVSSSAFGRRADVRIAVMVSPDGECRAFWSESWQYEPYEKK